MQRIFFLLLLWSSSGYLSIAQKKQTERKDNEVLFSVGSTTVTAGEFIYIYKKNHLDPAKDYTSENIKRYLDLFINFKLKVNEAKSLGYDTTSSFVKEFSSYKEELKRPFMADANLLDVLVKEAYERYKTEVNASHILITIPPDALPSDTLDAYRRISNIRQRVLSGEDFNALASSLSEDPSAKQNGGRLGWFTSMQMVYPFEQAAYTTRVGEVSGIVRTRFGYHILKVHDRRPASGEVEIAHIMFRTSLEKDSVKVRQLANDVYAKLVAGTSWDDMCKQYSDDVNTKNNGGKFRPFGVGAFSAVPEFEAAAFSLNSPGDLTSPFRTAFGWHIIKLINKIEVPDFEQMEAGLKNRISRDERMSISRVQLMERLKRQYNFSENTSVKSKAFSGADSSLNRAQWRPLTNENSHEQLASFKGKALRVADFFAYVIKAQQPNTFAPEKYIEQLYNSFIEKALMDLEEERLLKENKDFALLIKEYEEGLLLFDIMESRIWSYAVTDTLGQRVYFEANTHDYMLPSGVSATVYTHEKSEVLNALSGMLGNPGFVKNFADEHKIMISDKIFYHGQNEEVDNAWLSGRHAFLEEDGLYQLVVIQEKYSERPKTFDEARGDVISDYQNYLEKQWITELKQRYPIRLNEKSKKHVISALQR